MLIAQVPRASHSLGCFIKRERANIEDRTCAGERAIHLDLSFYMSEPQYQSFALNLSEPTVMRIALATSEPVTGILQALGASRVCRYFTRSERARECDAASWWSEPHMKIFHN
jgi:hypothetical protein